MAKDDEMERLVRKLREERLAWAEQLHDQYRDALTQAHVALKQALYTIDTVRLGDTLVEEIESALALDPDSDIDTPADQDGDSG